MPKTPTADDDEEFSQYLGTGCVAQLREHVARRGKPIQRAIGFVHFPERPAKKQGRRPKAKTRKRR